MIFTSPLIEAGSGSVAGLTFSRNKGGNYLRGRAIPTNPNSPLQQAVRSIMSQLTANWLNVLTAIQRVAWETYAEERAQKEREGQGASKAFKHRKIDRAH